MLPQAVHVWRIALAADDETAANLAACLDQTEQSRAAMFHFARDRRRFVVSHAATRHILASYLDVQAADLRFTHAPGGKPRLAPPFDSSHLHFNLSHAHELVLLAIAQGRPVGVDIEYIRPLPDALSLAEAFFAPAETARLRPFLVTSSGQRLFFTCWTRKEAFIKATGDGLSRPLDSFVVTFLPQDPPAVFQAQDAQSPIEGWTLIPLEPGPDYVAALVVAAP
ncbi:MAG: 4'-phosphopantetheinyl transferase superfamily protein [Anaerolineae bacterium]|nr:4'-phosphopantetheinyl transferase superfamily protein [Anaerolineae bacterium]